MRFFKIVLLLHLLFGISHQSFSQHQHDEGSKIEHLTFSDTFFGNEDDYQVCYPKDHRSFFYFIILFAVTSTLFGIIIIRNIRKHNIILKKVNALIEEKNKDLIDSITYSKRIQNTILPKQEVISKTLPQSFVLYKPKDIVSGDFYWYHTDLDYSYLAVVDCTGHGVPGAFLSLIGNTAINKAVKEDKLKDTSSILDKMNNYVKEMLQQQGDNELKDGMEVALCRIDTKNMEVQFSGANLGLIQVSDGNYTVHKGSKCSVGSVQPHVFAPPTAQNIKVKKGDTFYMHSDGIVDQFGGIEGKKFKSSGLKTLALQLNSSTMEEQCIQFNKEFAAWKGDLAQVDDVCVIGFRIGEKTSLE